MSENQLTVTTTADATEVATSIPRSSEMKVFANDSLSMQRGQQDLVTWCKGKLDQAREEWLDAKEIHSTAVEAGFRADKHRRLVTKCERRIEMFQKILAALEAGYMLVPNMSCDIFAVRTERDYPTQAEGRHRGDIPNEPLAALPAGDGRYVNPEQLVLNVGRNEKDQRTGEVKRVDFWRTSDFQDAIDFPAIIAHPQVMSEAQQAMSRRIFDGIAVCPPGRRKGDPLVLGIIKKPGVQVNRWAGNESSSWVTFLIAWYVDTRTI